MGCAVAGCKNYSKSTKAKGKLIRYHRFPKSKELAQQWAAACYRKDKINIKTAFICSEHFKPSSFELPLKHRLLGYAPRNVRNLRADAIPTENLPLEPKIVKVESGENGQSGKENTEGWDESNKPNITGLLVENGTNIADPDKLKQDKIDILEIRVKILEKQISELIEENMKYKIALSQVLTQEQMKKLLSPDK